MNKQREVLELALKAIESGGAVEDMMAAEKAIQEALAEPEQAPVADVDLYAVWSNGFHSRKPDMEPVAWSTRERFYEAVDRAVENVRQEMRVKTVTMRLPQHDVAIPIIDEHRGHVLVAPMAARKPLTDAEMRQCANAMDAEPLSEGWKELIKFARAIERSHGIGGGA